MPKYTLTHGGLKLNGAFHPHGAEVELSEADAADINSRGPHLKLSAVIHAEAEGDSLKASLVEKAAKASKGGAK